MATLTTVLFARLGAASLELNTTTPCSYHHEESCKLRPRAKHHFLTTFQERA